MLTPGEAEVIIIKPLNIVQKMQAEKKYLNLFTNHANTHQKISLQ